MDGSARPADVVARLPSSRRALLATLTLLLASGLALIVLESAARVLEAWAEENRARPADLAIIRENPHGTGSHRLKPDLDLSVQVKGRPFHIHTNRWGMHGRDVEKAKKPSRTRIALLGDSFTFGCWADRLEETWGGILEHDLPPRFEVLNFGVGGYGLDDDELILREEALDFAPDYVIVGLFTGNDFRDTWLGLHKYQVKDGGAQLDPEVMAARVPAPWRTGDDVFALPAPDPSPVRETLTSHSALARLGLPLLGLDHLGLDFRVSRFFNAFSFWSRLPPPPVALQARDEALATLGRMQAELQPRGIPLLIMAIPSREQVYATEESGPDYDIGLPQAWVQVWARERGIAYLDLLPPLRAHVQATGERLFVPADIHFDSRGHALAGHLAARWFRALYAPRAPAP